MPHETRHLSKSEQRAMDAAVRQTFKIIPDPEITSLRAALERLVYEVTHLSPREDDGSHWCKISAEALRIAREALKNV